MPEQVVVVRACPVCGTSNALVSVGRDTDSRGQLRREWVIDVDCVNDDCPSKGDPSERR